jgi:hypothetical protein
MWTFPNELLLVEYCSSILLKATAMSSIALSKSFQFECFIWTIDFLLITMTCHIGADYFAREWYDNLSRTKRKEFPNYMASLFHHFVVTVMIVYQLYRDYRRSGLATIRYIPVLKFLGPFSIGYMVSDFLTYFIPAAAAELKLDLLLNHRITGKLTAVVKNQLDYAADKLC